MESEDISFSDIVPHDDFNDAETEAPVVEETDSTSNKIHDDVEDADENNNEIEDSNINIDMDMIVSPTKRTKRLKSEVKRCVSKWILFSAEERPRIVEEFPEYTFPEIARTIAERYRNLSAHDSERLDEIVRLDKERYKMELAEAEDDLPGDLVGNKKSDDAALPISTLAFPMVSNWYRDCLCIADVTALQYLLNNKRATGEKNCVSC